MTYIIVLNERLTVLSFSNYSDFSILQSYIHEVWARNYGGTLRTDMMYSPSDCFETFPFPPDDQMDSLESIGKKYYEHRQSIMQSRQEGLTTTYNRFHDPAEKSDDIKKLRSLHIEMDQAVAKAYGWEDLEFVHGFHETKQGLRFTISEEARMEVLDRLLALNHQRYEEEVKVGLHEKKGGKKEAKKGKSKKKESKKGQDGQGELF